jgi:hypothetical protein
MNNDVRRLYAIMLKCQGLVVTETKHGNLYSFTFGCLIDEQLRYQHIRLGV